MPRMRLIYLLGVSVVALTVVAACVGSSNDSRSDVDGTAVEATTVVAATNSSTADGAAANVGATRSPTINDAAVNEAHTRVINCDSFVADVVPVVLGPAIPVVHRLPNQTLTDWVSYSDQFSIFTILDEQMQSEYVIRSIVGGSTPLGRSVTARIEETIWTAPGTEAVEGDITMVVQGWTTNHGVGLFPGTGPGRLEVGGRYMAPLVVYKYDAGNAWGIIEFSTLILDGEEVVGPLEKKGVRYMHVVRSRIGETVDEVATALACTEREERAVKYSGLLPEARWHAVQDDIKQNTAFDDPIRERLPD